MAQQLVTVFGGSGFIGRHLVRVLARRGWRIRAATRRPDLAGHLQPLGAVGQIHAVQANLRYRDSVARAIEGADAVVNLVGILFESGRQRFASVQAEGARIVAEETKRAGIGNLVHLSAIGADAASPSEYARSKAQGEAAVFANVPDAVILRPSVVFGPEDQFFNRFAGLARFAPVLPLIGGGETRFQPVYVGDVAEAAARTLEGGARPGTIYELGGPAILSFRAILEYILAETGRARPLVPLPFSLAKWQARLLEMLPNPLLTVDQVTLLERDNIVSARAIAEGRTLEG
ncbi:MAG: complex I NDUFA9 subunit family protein, partial [Rhabdaerophilum calidifontis]